MRIGVFADLHGNLPALEVLLARFSEEGADALLNLGDTTSLGPDSAAVIDRLQKQPLPAVHLYGNHDLSVIGIETKQPELIRPLEIEQHAYVRARLSGAHLDWIRSLKATHEYEAAFGRVLALHYATDDHGRYHPVAFQPERSDLDARFRPKDERVILYGHHHQPLILGERPLYVNPGSAGCPHQRAGIARAGILNLSGSAPHFAPFVETYDAEPVIRRIYDSDDPGRVSTLSIFFGVHIP